MRRNPPAWQTAGVTTAWEVPISELSRVRGSRRPVQVFAPIEDLGVTDSHVPEGADVTANVVLEALDEGAILVTGRVYSPWVGTCRRCLNEAAGTVVAEVRELFESEPEAEDIYPLGADRLDLEPLARDAVLLELPQAPLCKEDCLGLCPDCGADRNAGDCGHAADDIDPRWAALEDLRDN